MSEEEWNPPDWINRDPNQPADDTIFEILTRAIFMAGLSWDIVERKWPNFVLAFDNFSIEQVAQYDDEDLGRLIEDKGIIRNQQKIEATIHNAQEFLKIKQEYGSFHSFLDSLDKSENYSKVKKNFGKRFKRVGNKTANIFLYCIGEIKKKSNDMK